jgi:hypothetical protein
MVRHNLTVAARRASADRREQGVLAGVLRRHRVEVVSSLPYYQQYFTDAQRGAGVFGKSIEAMKRLNAVGYGVEGAGSPSICVYNPVGPYLPAAQAALEADYKRELKAKFGLSFNRLYTLTNMPINRFRLHPGEERAARGLPRQARRRVQPGRGRGRHVPHPAQRRLRRTHLRLRLQPDARARARPTEPAGRLSIFDFDYDAALGRRIAFGEHCLGCTAGAAAPAAARRLECENGLSHLEHGVKIFGFAGWSGSGKTTLIEKLIPRFVGAGCACRSSSTPPSHVRRRPAGQGFVPPSPCRRVRGPGHLVAALGADARAARRPRAAVRGAGEALLAVRPPHRRGLQVRADPEARGLARRDRGGLLHPNDPHIVAVASDGPVSTSFRCST